ncbi:MAG: hypothetical protein IJ479_06255 [Alphaproteobacteria bacterium]|nr:hypothetical protein [Alphaproteobacteria bacterium]
MKNINRNMLHMKLNSAVSMISIASALAVFLPPSNALAGVCFLPDCQDEDLAGGGGNMDLNEDTKFCESKGFTYYASGKCPQYYAEVGRCNRDDHYLKCDAKTWCEQNGYKTTSCSIPNYVDQPCPSYGSLYKGCKVDNQRACRDTGYTNSCPSGQKLKKNSGRCSYDSSYGTCCKPSGCPAYTSTNSSSYGTNGTDGCEYACYYTCNMNCPSGTSTSNPGGCGGSTRNGCNTKTCYYPYKACCSPLSDQNGCNCYSCSDGCGGTRQCCGACPPPSYSRTSIETVWDHGACFLKCNYQGGRYHISRGCWDRQDWCEMAKADPNSSGRCPSTMSSFSHDYPCGYFTRRSITTVWDHGMCFLKCTYTDDYDGESRTHVSIGCWSRQDWCDMAKNDPEQSGRCPRNMTYSDFNSAYSCT